MEIKLGFHARVFTEFVKEGITSSSETLKFLNTCLACLRDSLLRSASVPVTVFCFRICGELVLESS